MAGLKFLSPLKITLTYFNHIFLEDVLVRTRGIASTYSLPSVGTLDTPSASNSKLIVGILVDLKAPGIKSGS